MHWMKVSGDEELEGESALKNTVMETGKCSGGCWSQMLVCVFFYFLKIFVYSFESQS